MFYEVRIFNPNGKLKKVVPSKTLDQVYWEGFFDKGWGDTFLIKSAKKQKGVKAMLDMEFDEPLPLKEVEQRTISNALKMTNGNIPRAAEKLGISRSTFYRMVKKYGLN